jgi:hypothetical protein
VYSFPIRSKIVIPFILSCYLTLSGCGTTPQVSPVVTHTPVPTTMIITPSATTVWFPATPTPKASPTPPIPPTPDLRPGLGDVIFTDSFHEQSNWETYRSEKGTILFGNDELTITISQPKASLSTFRKADKVKDFYLELTASPSLCRNGDSYGVLFRANSSLDYYRLIINCSGELRLESVRNGVFTVLQDWVTSSQVPPGSPLIIRVGVWAFGNEKNVFINDHYQFTVTDPVWEEGFIGLFARSAGDTALTVTFSDLSLRMVEKNREINTPDAGLSTPLP